MPDAPKAIGPEQSRGRGATRPPAWSGYALVLHGLMLAAAAPTASAQATEPDGPPVSPGFVTVDGQRLFVSCQGTSHGLPTVVFENGLGESYRTWRDVQPAISELTRTCAYDRLGAGRSDPVAPDDTRTPFELASTLRALLDELEVDGPMVLVGHSIAGLLLLAYAHLYSEELAGLVFVDASHPEQWVRFRELDPEAVSPVGVSGAERIDRGAARSEWAAVGRFEDMPIAVLYQAAPSSSPRRPIWVELQNDHASRSSRSRVIPATASGHYVHNDEPELVIREIRRILTGG
jgi:pimeloyl-ACP methyl ester carboxylesterase